MQIDRLVEKVSAESKQRGGNVLTDPRARDRSYWIEWTLIFWLNEFEVSAKLVEVGQRRFDGSIGASWIARSDA